MAWLEATDTALFYFVNHAMANPVFDAVMPLLAGHVLFVPAVLLTALAVLWKGGPRGRVFVPMLALAVALTDGFLCNAIRDAVRRPRPAMVLTDTRALLRTTRRGSLPSAHAANWFAAAAVVGIYYRRRWLPVAAVAAFAGVVAFSRVYNGVHYPGDVLAGAVLGAGTGLVTVWLVHALWTALGPRWFPRWWSRWPSLANPPGPSAPGAQAGG
ncbi:MAG: phosphatase PAP2 family protein [Verrucomicrobia bacterium]|nr:phosphatase PAP2 family protein [Verrucomicrobiota bacterium]